MYSLVDDIPAEQIASLNLFRDENRQLSFLEITHA